MWTREYLERHRPASLPAPDSDCYVNWIGMQTEADLFPAASSLIGAVRPNLPLPDDGVYGSDTEYASALMAVDYRADPTRFTAVELGAGWGPWVTLAGVAAQRSGATDIRLVGVEAHEGRCEAMQRQFKRNGLEGRALHAAVWPENKRVRFGTVDAHTDHGGAATDKEGNKDYRGLDASYIEVDGLTLPAICEGLGVVDYMHWDIQGAELPIARAFMDFLDANVRYIFIGTHSIAIHGGLIDLFYQHRWAMLHHSTPEFHYDREASSLEGMNTKDGEILFANPDLMERMQRDPQKSTVSA